MSMPQLIGDALQFITLFPLDVPEPNDTIPPFAEKLKDLMGWVKWVALALVVVSIIIMGVQMALKRSNRGNDTIENLMSVFAGVLLIGSAVSIVGFLV